MEVSVLGSTGDLYLSVKKNEKYGFYELADRFRKQMKDFYEEEYYQQERAAYQKKAYDELDMNHKRNIYSQKMFVYESVCGDFTSNNKCFLDIGAGEGYAMDYFYEHGWAVAGIDFSSYGMEIHNPQMLAYLHKGDFYQVVRTLENNGKKYEFINADNVLEHLPKPEEFFGIIRKIAHEGTVVAVSVPNDFSRIQKLAYEMDMIDGAFWVTPETSEHFNYFSVDSLTALGEDAGFDKIIAVSDWPIDFFLLHGSTNYKIDSSVGHDCHVACLELENSLYKDSMKMTIDLFAALANAGLGRQINLYFRLN